MAAFPTSPTVNDTHIYGATTYKWNGTGWQLITTLGIGAATGGTVTTDGDYKVHTFTSGGTFTVTSAPDVVEYLVIAGGGGGASYSYGGGGGAGGYRTAADFAVTATAYSITVGGGGAGGTGNSAGSQGSNSVFSTIIKNQQCIVCLPM